MKITGIDCNNTKSVDRAAFIVDTPPDLEVLGRVQIRNVSINYDGSLLYVNLGEGLSCIDDYIIKEINDLYLKEEQEVNKERRKKAYEHERMILSLNQSTKLPFRLPNGTWGPI